MGNAAVGTDMEVHLPRTTASRLKVSATALFVVVAVGTLYEVVSNGSVKLVSLFVLEIGLMLLYIAWNGVLQPLRAQNPS